MGNSAIKKTAFQRWFEGSAYTQEGLADELTIAVRRTIRQAQISAWLRGLYSPKTEIRLLIKKLSNDQVGMEDW